MDIDIWSLYSQISKIAFPIVGLMGGWMLWSLKALINSEFKRVDAKVDLLRKEYDLRFDSLEKEIEDRKKFENDLPQTLRNFKEDLREIIRLEVNQK